MYFTVLWVYNLIRVYYWGKDVQWRCLEKEASGKIFVFLEKGAGEGRMKKVIEEKFYNSFCSLNVNGLVQWSRMGPDEACGNAGDWEMNTKALVENLGMRYLWRAHCKLILEKLGDNIWTGFHKFEWFLRNLVIIRSVFLKHDHQVLGLYSFVSLMWTVLPV
jgi:hypothetical protein